MKMTDLLEKDRENILTSITQAGTAAKAVTILENETDKLLLKFNDQCDSDREREAAAHMMQAVRLSVPMIDSAGKTKVWERGSDDSAKRKRKSQHPVCPSYDSIGASGSVWSGASCCGKPYQCRRAIQDTADSQMLLCYRRYDHGLFRRCDAEKERETGC